MMSKANALMLWFCLAGSLADLQPHRPFKGKNRLNGPLYAFRAPLTNLLSASRQYFSLLLLEQALLNQTHRQLSVFLKRNENKKIKAEDQERRPPDFA